MSGFTEVVNGIYYLAAPNTDFGAGVTLVRGRNNFLIDSGAFDYSVSKFIVPALKALKMDIKNIDYLLFTHCNADNIGGIQRIKQLNPDIKVITYGHQADRLKNPSYYFMKKWSEFLDYSPPFREMRGVLADGSVDAKNKIFTELRPILAQGHDSDCVCWYHPETETLICGDAVQGNGTEETGIAFISSLQLYKNTLSDLIETAPENMICARDFRGCSNIIKGKENCIAALEYSLDTVNDYAAFVDKYAKLVRKKKENLDIEELVRAYFEGAELPQTLGYAMKTLSEFMRSKR